MDWSGSHNGVRLCTIDKTIELMPETNDLLLSILPHLQYPPTDYLVDVKVHMLMPGQYPCIPNWHCDFVPRDANKNKQYDLIRPNDLMYIHVSSEPKTEFKTYQYRFTTISGYEWTAINQTDVHRGKMAEEFVWRCFVRLVPKWFLRETSTNVGELRRHSQVYIPNPDQYTW